MTAQREVLFATINAGGGHIATANAMAEAVDACSGGALVTRVAEVMPELGFAELDRRHKESWRRMLGRPRLIRWAQRALDAAPVATRAAHDLLLSRFAEVAAAHYQAAPPALIVVNHGWLATALTLARSRYGLQVPVVVFATEPFDASALWSTPAAETVLAPSAAAAQSLARLGVKRSALHVAGYPVARRFLEAPSRDEARSALGLGEAFTVLVSLGAEGVVGEDLLSTIESLAGGGVQLLCVCGRNQELKRRLEDLAQRCALPPRVYGFVADMQTHLAASDLVIGKACPASTMEALAVGRPVIATSYAGLNELAVVRYLVASGQGALAAGSERVIAAVAAWRSRGAAAKTRRPDFAAMTRGIGEYLTRRAQGEAASATPGSAPSALSALAPGAFAAVDEAMLATASLGGGV